MKLIIDGNNLANMCSYISGKSKNILINGNNLDVTAVDIFMKKLYTLFDNLYPDDIIICWDRKLSKGIKNFRKEDGTYKANRTNDNEVLYQQCDIIENLTAYLGIKNFHPNIMEADDIIAWICQNPLEPNKIIIASFDKDLLQLVNNDVEYYDLRKKQRITVNNFEEKIGIKRTRFLLYKMILGDRSDNIQGLKGYGKIKAKKLAESDEPFKELDQEQLKILIKNKKLMDLSVGYTVYPEEVETYKEQYYRDTNKNFNKFYDYAISNNIQYVKDYKWKWEDFCLNT